MSDENVKTLEQELVAGFDSIERVEYMVKTSTFRGEAAFKLTGTLEILQNLKQDIIRQLKESKVEKAIETEQP